MPGVRLVRPNGEVVEVPEDTAALLRGLGYRDQETGERAQVAGQKATADYYSGVDQTLRAAGEGMVGSLTAGLMTPDGVEAQQRAAFHPLARGAGAIAGALLPIGAGGAIGAVGRGIGGVAGAAVEGGLFGATGAVDEARVSGDPLTVESVVAGAGLGAVLGAGAGVLAEGVGGLAKRALPEVQKVPEVVDLSAARAAALPVEEFGKLRTALSDLRKVTERGAQEAEGAARAQASGLAERDLHAELAGLKDAGNAVLSDAQVKNPKLLFKMRPQIQKAIKAMQRAEDVLATGSSEKAVQVMLRAREHIADLEGVLNTGHDVPEIAGLLPRNRAAEKLARESHDAVTGALAHFPSTPEEFLTMKAPRAEVALAALDRAMRHAGPGSEAALAAVNSFAAGVAERAGIQVQGGAVPQLRAAWEALRVTRAPKVTEALKKAAGGEGFLRGILRRGAHRAGGVTGSVVTKRLGLGLLGGAMGYQFGGSAGAAAVGALAGAGGPGVIKEAGGLRALATARIARAVESYAPVVARGVRAVGTRISSPLRTGVSGTQDVSKNPQELFAHRAAELRELGATAPDRAFALSGALGRAGHREFGDAAGQVTMNALAHVLNQMPKDPGTQPWGLGTLWRPSPAQVEVFGRVYEAVMRPLDAIERALSGDLHPAAVQALAAAWPAIYGEVRRQLLERLSTDTKWAEGLGRTGLSDLGTFLQRPLTPLQRPEFVTAQAAMFAEPPRQVGPDPGSSGGQPGRPSPEAPTAAQRRLA